MQWSDSRDSAQLIGGSTLPDKWHILVCHMEAALLVRAHPCRQMEHSSSLITESVCVAANGGCMGFFIIGDGDTAIMCSTISAGLFPEYGLCLGHLSL